MTTGVNRNIGMLVLAVWLILTGLSGMIALRLPTIVMAVLALSRDGEQHLWLRPLASPTARPVSRELYYVAADGRMMVVPIGTGSTPDPGAPRCILSGDLTPITVVVNWPGALTK